MNCAVTSRGGDDVRFGGGGDRFGGGSRLSAVDGGGGAPAPAGAGAGAGAFLRFYKRWISY